MFNNPYYNAYNPYMQYGQQQQIIQVNGKASVDTIQLAPNSSILVMDTSAPIVANKVQSIMPTYQGEFGEVVSGVSIDGLMNVLNEHMEVIKLLYPKEYQAVLQRIREIP